MQNPPSKWRRLSGEEQTDQFFDQQIIERMGREFCDQVFVSAIQQSIARILVESEGSLTIEAKPEGLLGMNDHSTQLEGWEGPALLEPKTLVTGDRRWKLIAARVE